MEILTQWLASEHCFIMTLTFGHSSIFEAKFNSICIRPEFPASTQLITKSRWVLGEDISGAELIGFGVDQLIGNSQYLIKIGCRIDLLTYLAAMMHFWNSSGVSLN